ncbi:MAG: cytochrome P450 [Alphaproteobacteria bacterium]|nr:cytochrome P450 [Alphaproteobacteria bacterium]
MTRNLTFMDPAVVECPYPAYQRLLDDSPVFLDPVGGFYILSRYEDVRQALLDTRTYICEDFTIRLRDKVQAERAERARRRFADAGWVPGPSILMLPDSRHREVRKVFERAFRAGKIKEVDDFVRDTAYQLVDAFAADGRCDIVRHFAVPLPLIVIGTQVGVPRAEAWKIKEWTDAWINRLGMLLSEEEDARAVEMEIEAQHYLKQIMDRLRETPDGTVLSDLVNTTMSDGLTLSDEELFTHLLADIFVAGSETTTNSLSAGVMLLCQHEEWYARLKADQETYLRPFIEEVLRVESPVQGLFRVAGRDIELHGVTIPKGAVIQLRYGAANRDERHFACPASFDLDRRNAGSHLAFGSGVHHCIGAPLARREMYWGFKALLDRLDDLRLEPGSNDFSHMRSIMHRALKNLHVTFDARLGADR